MAPTAPASAAATTKAPRKKKVTGAEPTRRSSRAVVPREIFSSAPAKSKVTKKTQKRKPTVGDKIAGTAKKVKGAVTKKPAVKAAGTKKIKGTDGKSVKK